MNITLPRATAEQALEALESVLCDPEGKCCIDGSDADRAVVDKALAAFRAALAQQAEPVEAAAQYSDIVSDGGMDPRNKYDTAPPQQAEPVEPVAYIHRQGNHWEVSERHLDEDEKARGWTDEPLYTAPPQRKPLTDEKISDLWCEVSNTDFVTADTHVFARAVERTHGIKE